MSQAEMAGSSFGSQTSRTSTNKLAPIALLGLAVVIGVALLHGLDDAPTATQQSLATTEAAKEAAAVPAAQAPPTTLAVRLPAEVKVLITNGTTVSGVAAKFNDAIRPRGYQLGTPGNTTTPTSESSIQFAPGYEAEARALATTLNLSEGLVKPMTIPAPVDDVQLANVVVVIGSQLAANPPASAQSSSQSPAQSPVIGPLQSSSSAASSAGSTPTSTTVSTAAVNESSVTSAAPRV